MTIAKSCLEAAQVTVLSQATQQDMLALYGF